MKRLDRSDRTIPLSSRSSRPLRVCHLAYTFYENDNRVRRYADLLARRGDEVDVIALRRPGQRRLSSHGDVRVYRIQRRSKTESRALSYLLKLTWFLIKSTIVVSLLAVRRRYDLVHVHNVPDFLVFAAIVPRALGARIVLDIHDILPELYAGKFAATDNSPLVRSLLLVECLSCRFAHHVIVANHLWEERLVQRAVAADKCTTIMNYPDLDLFKPMQTSADHRKFVIIYPGTLNHHQGVDIAVRAFALVRDRMPDAELHVYGEGPGRAIVERLAADCTLGEQFKLMGTVPIEEIARIMATAAVGLVPKRASGFGNEAFSTKTLEFMACGVPVILSRTRIDAYYFNDLVVRFFQPEDDRSLADALLDAYEHRASFAERAERAREFAIGMGWQKRYHEYEELVTSLIQRDRHATRAA